jgi:DNA polymerase-3 subunit beta
MKITCERSYLANALGVAGRAVSNRNTLPILSNVLIETQEDRIKMTSTDLDTAIRVVIPAQVEESGAIAVPVAFLSSLVSRLKDAPVTLEAQDGKATVRSGKSDYTLLSLPAEDFPVVPSVEDGTQITLLQSQLKDMLRLTTFAASREESRSILMGVLFDARGDTLTLVATDTHRLARRTLTLPQAVESPISAIIPARPLAELERVLKDTSEESVTIRFGAQGGASSSQVQFETADVTLVSRVLDGQFPNYEKVIPKTHEREITMDRGEFFDVVRRVSLVAKESADKVIMETDGDVLRMNAESADMGQGKEEVAISMTGENLKIAFNADYLQQVLNLLHGEKVTLKLTGPLNPGLLESSGETDFTYVLMPMQA